MPGIRITGTGHFVPLQVVTNEDYTKIVDTSDEWITSRTGMRERHISTDEPTWSMGSKAAHIALDAAGIAPNDIDMIIGTTVTSDYDFPSMACLVQRSLEIESCLALDISVACAAFVAALDMARRYLHSGDINRVLIVSSEVLSQVTDYTDRSTCILFADGAGACVVERDDKLFGSFQDSDASGAHHIYSKRSRRKHPFNGTDDTSAYDMFETVSNGYTQMNGQDVYKFATKAMPDAVQRACAKAGITVGDLDLVIPHQANMRIVKTATKNLGINPDKVYTNIQLYGNISSATIPLALDECIRSQRVKRGDKVCLVGFGSGLVYGACVFEY